MSGATQDGWINISSDPVGAKVFVDNKELIGPDGKQLTTPCTAYIPAGSHIIKLTSDGYWDKEYQVLIAENLQTADLVAHLEKKPFPAVAIPGEILLISAGIVIGLEIAVLARKKK